MHCSMRLNVETKLKLNDSSKKVLIRTWSMTLVAFGPRAAECFRNEMGSRVRLGKSHFTPQCGTVMLNSLRYYSAMAQPLT